MPATFATLVRLDKTLGKHGRPRIFRTGSWWAAEAERFYAHATAREWWGQVGRAGAKSTVIYRLCVNETIHGDWIVPPGERHWATIKSRSKEEAAKGIGIISADLTALGVQHTVSGDVIELRDAPLGIRITASSVGGTSGWRSYFDANDELAKWPRDGAIAVDAREVISSGRAMTATHGGARRLYFSSAFTIDGPHYDAIQAGDSDRQIVSVAASWEANPIVTEEETRRLEPTPHVWAREYASIPQASSMSALDPAHVDRAMRITIPADWEASRRVIILDPSSGKADSFTWCTAGWRSGGDRKVLEIRDVGGVADAVKQAVTSDYLVEHVAKIAKQNGAHVVHADQAEQFALGAAFRRHGLEYVVHPWTQTNKEAAVLHLRSWLRDDRIALPGGHARLKTQLLSLTEMTSSNGGLTFRGRGSSHDDYALLIMMAALVDIERGLQGSVTGQPIPGEGWLGFARAEIAKFNGLNGGHSPLRIESATDRVTLIAPPKYRCMSLGAQRVYHVGIDGVVAVHPDDVDLYTKYPFGFRHHQEETTP